MKGNWNVELNLVSTFLCATRPPPPASLKEGTGHVAHNNSFQECGILVLLLPTSHAVITFLSTLDPISSVV